MLKYVLYSRTAEGHIERLIDRIYKCPYCAANEPNPFSCPVPSINCYVYEEQLIGWPEPKVFWEKKTGPSIGIAPLYQETLA